MSTVKESHVLRGVLCALGGATCWGFSGTCAQLLTTGYGIPVSWITCVRLLFAAAIFLTICLIKDRKKLIAVFYDRESLTQIVLFAIFGVLMTQIAYLTTISYTNAGTGTVLERLGVVVIMAYVCLRNHRLPCMREAIGLVLAVLGTFLVATKGNFGILAIPPEALFFGTMSAFALACYTLLPVKPLKKWGSLIVTGLAMLIGGTVATVFTQPWTIPVVITPDLVGVMVAMTLVGTIAAYLLYLQGISDAGPVKAGLIGSVEPISATVISAVWLHTPVWPMDIVGMALIIGMVFLITQHGSKPDEPACSSPVISASNKHDL